MTIGAPAPHDIFTDNHRWGDVDEWNRAALALHDSGPIHRIEREGFSPFWAVVGHPELLEIERQSELFTNGPEAVLTDLASIEQRQLDIKTLIHMDAPDHPKYRRLTANWFRPASINRLNDRLQQLSDEAVAKLAAAVDDSGWGRCDFANDIALPFPLQVILKILGLPEEDYPRMLMLTQQLFGGQDPDLQREELTPEVLAEVLGDFYAYFVGLTAERRANPTEDLATLIATGTIDGEPMPDLETLGYYVIIATAGHDTTSSAMSGGMHALLEHPDQLAAVQADIDLVNNAVEEMIRWTAPVRHFMRTATEDTVVAGQPIAKGDWLYLSYKAANLDPRVFDDPLRFDITRPNADKNVSFGFGMHYCLGAQLARNELRRLFATMLPALDEISLDGDAATTKTTFVGGHKTLPIRYRMRG
ncbi:MAG: cytochrome P450 [Actinomycetota bacterium]